MNTQRACRIATVNKRTNVMQLLPHDCGSELDHPGVPNYRKVLGTPGRKGEG